MARQDGSCIVLQRVLRPLGRTCLSGSAMHDPSWHSSDDRIFHHSDPRTRHGPWLRLPATTSSKCHFAVVARPHLMRMVDALHGCQLVVMGGTVPMGGMIR